MWPLFDVQADCVLLVVSHPEFSGSQDPQILPRGGQQAGPVGMNFSIQAAKRSECPSGTPRPRKTQQAFISFYINLTCKMGRNKTNKQLKPTRPEATRDGRPRLRRPDLKKPGTHLWLRVSLDHTVVSWTRMWSQKEHTGSWHLLRRSARGSRNQNL